VPHSHLVIRTPDGAAGPRSAGTCAAQAVIDHVSYTGLNFNRAERRPIDRHGRQERARRRAYSLHMDDAFGYDVQLSGLDNNALTDV